MKTPKLTTTRLVTLALLVGLNIIVSHLGEIRISSQLHFSFTFIVNAVIGAVGGPFWSFISLVVLDLATIFFSPDAASFLPVWTLMEGMTGFLYGFFFYGKSLNYDSKKDWIYVSVAVLTIMIFSTFIMTPLLNQIYFHMDFVAQYITGRWVKIFEWPIRVIPTIAILSGLQRIPDFRRLMGISPSK